MVEVSARYGLTAIEGSSLERSVGLVGLEGRCNRPDDLGVGAEVETLAAHHRGRVDAAVIQQARQERGGRRLAVRPRREACFGARARRAFRAMDVGMRRLRASMISGLEGLMALELTTRCNPLCARDNGL